MLDEALNLHYRIQNRGQYPFPVLNVPKEIPAPNIVQPVVKSKNWQKSILPACTIGSGALLMYLGVRRPNITEKIHNLYSQKYSGIVKEIVNFKSYANRYLDKEYKEVLSYISKYREDRAFDYLNYTARIQDSQNGSEVLSAFDDAFSVLGGIRKKDLKIGASGMDEFRSYMYNVNHPAYNHLSEMRTETSFRILDSSLMPRFKNGAHKEVLEGFEKKLAETKVYADEKLFDAQNEITDKHINSASKYMARTMLNTRKELQTSAETVMDYTFAKFAKLYNLGDDFKPLFRTGRDSAAIDTLQPENLLPQPLSARAAKILNNSYLKEILETVDFNNMDKATVKMLFERIPYTFDTKQADMFTDRLRLQQVLDIQNNAETPELQIITKKLEYLTDKLEAFGKENLISKCSRDFSDITPEQLHAKLYYINSDARKIGLAGLEEVDKFMIEQSPEYLDSTFKAHVNGVLAHPEKYFM